MRLSVELDLSADYPGVAAETALPEGVTQHRYSRVAELFLFSNDPAQQRGQPQNPGNVE
jgi:hypothetical protein